MQLRLDKMESMQQTGIFNTVSVNDFIQAQKSLYASANGTLQNNAAFLKLAEDNIRNTLTKYYAPLGYKVNIVFSDSPLQNNGTDN